MFNVVSSRDYTCGAYANVNHASLAVISSAVKGGTLVAAITGSAGTSSILYSVDEGLTWTAGTGTDTTGYAWTTTSIIGTDPALDSLFVSFAGGFNAVQTSPTGAAWTPRVPTGNDGGWGMVGGPGSSIGAVVSDLPYIMVTNGTNSSSYDGFYTAISNGQTDGYNFTRRDVFPVSRQWGAFACEGFTSDRVMSCVARSTTAGGDTDTIATHLYNGSLITLPAWTQRMLSQTGTWYHNVWNGRCSIVAERTTTKACRSYDGWATSANITLPIATAWVLVANTTTGALLCAGGDGGSGDVNGYCSVDDGTTWAAVSLVNTHVHRTGLHTGNRFFVFGDTAFNPGKAARQT